VITGNAPLVDIKGITKVYRLGDTDLEVLRGVTLSIREGEFVAIMGPSGSGKSTLMHILGLLDRPTAGQYSIAGRDILNLSDDETAFLRSKTIGFVFQQFNLLPRMTACDNVALPLIYSRAQGRRAVAEKHLRQVGLEDRLDHRPNQLSGGQQQRVAIARALVNNPKIIFADEPTGNLASAQADEVMRMLTEFNRAGITVIMVTHEPDIAAWASRAIHIKDGQITDDKTRSDAPPLPAPTKHAHTTRGSAYLTAAELAENFMSALRAMAANKMRSFLTMLGVIIGVAAIVAMMALGRGAQKAIEDQLSAMGSNLVMIMPGSSGMGGVFGARASRFTAEDIKVLAENKRLVANVDGNVQDNEQVVFGPNNTNTQITGAYPVYAAMHNAVPVYGRFFTGAENENMEKVAVIGQTVATNLFGANNPVGHTIKIARKNFKVIGLLPAKGASGFRDQNDMIVIPLNTAMKRSLGKKYINQIWLEAKDASSVDALIDYAASVIRKRHRIPPGKDDDFQIMNMSDLRDMLSSTTNTMSMLLGVIAGISLVVGGIGIMNIMLVSVSERTREIGLRKAIGASRAAILTQFLIEAAALSISGGALGIALGAGSAVALAKIANWTLIVSPSSVIMSAVFSASVGILFGFWPAKKASELSPIEALRYE